MSGCNLQAVVFRPSSSRHHYPLLSGCYRPSSSGRCRLTDVVRPLSSGRICQAVVFRPSTSCHHYLLLSGCRQAVIVRPLSSGRPCQTVVVMPLLGCCRQVIFIRLSSSGRRLQAIIIRCCQVIVRPSSSGRCHQAVVVRPEEYESNVNHNMNQSVTRNLIGNAKMRSPTYFLSFIPLQIRLNLLKNLSKSQKHVQMLLGGFGAIMV